MIHREETVTLTKGTGDIAVRGDQWANALYVHGRPIALHWCDCAGSVGQEFLVLGGTVEGEFTDNLSLVAELPPIKRPLGQHFAALLGQFPNGKYELTLEELTDRWYWPGWEPDWWQAEWEQVTITGMYPSYHPFDDNPIDSKNLIATQPGNWLRDDRVHQWIEAIEQGKRPVAVIAGIKGSWGEFVLDGHHKLAAYAHLRIPPWCFCIWAPETPLTEADWPDGYYPSKAFMTTREIRRVRESEGR